MSRRVLVTGGRDYRNGELVFRALDAAHAAWGVDCIIEGGQRKKETRTGRIVGGADYWANQWAVARGIECLTFEADWTKFKNSAGPIRNAKMLHDGKPGIVLAFPGGTGTADMKKRANRAGVPVVTFSQ